MPRKIAVIALAGIAIGVGCIAAAVAVDGERLSKMDWDNIHFGIDDCEAVPGATARTLQLAWDSHDDRVTIAVPADVHYHPGEGGDSVSASGDPDILAHLRVHHHTIELDCDNGLHGRKLSIVLPGRAFRTFNLAGSGKLDLDQLDQPSVEMKMAGSGAIKASGKVDSMKITLAGSGTVEASGTADTVKLTIAGSGDARLGQLAAKMVEVDIAGSGDADIAPSDEAKIKIAGSGDVRLLTDPKQIDTNIFGSGRILHGAAH